MKEYKMRRSDREAPFSAAEKILYSGEYGVLSTLGEDGTPYGVPLNYAYDGEKIYFHCAKNTGHKQKNLSFCNRVSFCVVCGNAVKSGQFTEKFESVIVFGTAKKSDTSIHYGLEMLIRKYSPDFLEKGLKLIESSDDSTDVYEISIEKISAKIHK